MHLYFQATLFQKASNSIAQAYAGHQFGYFTELGDGRAILIGEHITDNKRFDIQLKGAGITLYSRNGDGRATLVSMLREYLISESMHGLNIPTSRSLAVVSTGENVIREKNYMGGILTRIAASHIRVGTFQYLSAKGDIKNLEMLTNYTLDRHFPNEKIDTNRAITLLKLVRDKQISLIINWMRVGFIHGVMNSDNTSIFGETIDYGPCSFMDTYDPKTVYSSIDINGRYSFENQSIIAHWNISRFAETLIPLLDKSENKAIERGKGIINEYETIFQNQWLNMMKIKLGFFNNQANDYNLITELLEWMKSNKADYTNTFLKLMNKKLINDNIYNQESFYKISYRINMRIKDNNTALKNVEKKMIENNPIIIPRNYLVEKSLSMIDENKNYDLYFELLKAVKRPYTVNKDIIKFQKPPNKLFEKNYKTFCGT